MRQPIRAVLFDYAGTLFAPEDEVRWVHTVLARCGVRLAPHEVGVLASRLSAAGRPGPVAPSYIPPELMDVFANRDLTTTFHRAAYTGLLGSVRLPAPVTADDLYDRCSEPDAWIPYADALPVLLELHGRGISTVVVSNVGFDLRPIFAHHELDPLISSYVLSYEVGLAKPDVRMFLLACERAKVRPDAALMVGDSPTSDGAVNARIRTLLLPAAPAGTWQNLDAVLALTS